MGRFPPFGDRAVDKASYVFINVPISTLGARKDTDLFVSLTVGDLFLDENSFLAGSLPTELGDLSRLGKYCKGLNFIVSPIRILIVY